MWAQIIEQKKEWIGGVLQDISINPFTGEPAPETELIDIEMKQHFNDDKVHLCNEIIFTGKDYTCSGNTKFVGLDTSGKEGFLQFIFVNMPGEGFRIKKPVPADAT